MDVDPVPMAATEPGTAPTQVSIDVNEVAGHTNPVVGVSATTVPSGLTKPITIEITESKEPEEAKKSEEAVQETMKQDEASAHAPKETEQSAEEGKKSGPAKRAKSTRAAAAKATKAKEETTPKRAQAGRKTKKSEEVAEEGEPTAAPPARKRKHKLTEEVTPATQHKRIHEVEEAAKRIGSGDVQDAEVLLNAAYHHLRDHHQLPIDKVKADTESKHLEIEATTWMPAFGQSLEHVGVSASLRASALREVATNLGITMKLKEIAQYARCPPTKARKQTHNLQSLVTF